MILRSCKSLNYAGKAQISKGFALYLGYVLLILIIDYSSFVITIGFPFAAIFIPLLLLYLYAISIIIRHLEFSLIKILSSIDLFATLIILAFFIYKVAMPDKIHDTVLGWYFLQSFKFIDTVNVENYFPAGIATYYYPLAGRMSYLFTYCLGYRAGTLLNSLVLLLLYYQTKEILILLGNKINKKLSLATAGLLALYVILSEYLLLNSATYFVDLLALPLLVELVKQILFSKNRNHLLPYGGLLLGLSVALKLTNIPFVIILMFTIIWLARKKIIIDNSAVLVVTITVFTLSFLHYSWYIYSATGNPVFPFFNSLFKSEFFTANNFKDLRWGPVSYYEYILWPIIIMFDPNRFSELSIYSGKISLAYIAILLLHIFRGLNKVLNFCYLNILQIIIIGSGLFWSLTSGYARYVLFLELLSGIFLAFLAFYFLDNQIIRKKVKYILIICALVFQVTVVFKYIIIDNNDWSYRISLLSNPVEYLNNFKMVFKDHTYCTKLINDSKKNGISGWLILDHNTAYALAFDRNIPIMNYHWQMVPQTFNDSYLKEFRKRYYNNIYTLATYRNIHIVINRLSDIGYSPLGIKTVKHPMLPVQDYLYLIQIDKERSEYILSNNLIQDYDFSNKRSGDSALTGWNYYALDRQLVDENGNNILNLLPNEDISQWVVGIKDTNIYKYSLDYRVSEYKKIRLQLVWFNDEQFIDVTIHDVEPTTLNEWDSTKIFTAPPGGANRVFVYLLSMNGVTEFDNISLREIEFEVK